MDEIIWISLVLILAGGIGYYVAYYKGRRAFLEQMALYGSGVILGIRDNQELYQKILAIHHPAIKNIWIGDDGSVSVEGKRGTHGFYVDNVFVKIKYPYSMWKFHRGIIGSIKQMRIHKDIAAMVEANQIMDTVVANQQPNNVEEKVRGYEKASMGAKILKPSLAVAIMGIILLCVGVSQGTDTEYIRYIQYVKNGCPSDGSTATFDDIFNFCLETPEWEYFETDQNEYIVQVSGSSSVSDDWLLIQFAFNDVNSESDITPYSRYRLYYMEVNGIACTVDDAKEIMDYLVQSYIG